MKETRIIRGVRAWNRDKETVLIDLDVEIDIDGIARELATKAFNNKRRKSRTLHGLVEVKMRGTKVTPVHEKLTA